MLHNPLIPTILRASDDFRRSAGMALDRLQMGPVEAHWELMLSQPGFTLRRYGDAKFGAVPVLIVPAPIKRPYIFDLLPPVSVVRRLQEKGFVVYVIDWRQPKHTHISWGLADYAVAWIGTAASAIADKHVKKPVLVGHSLGGTLAAIFTASQPDRIQRLLLILAPLRFGAEAGAFAPIVNGSPRTDIVMQFTGGTSGTLLDVASSASAPEEFIAGRWQDAVASLFEPSALDIHQRVVRWTLDEFAPPEALFTEIVELLYRGDAFARGELRLSGMTISTARLAELPVAAVVDKSSRVVPPASSLAPLVDPAVYAYEREVGVALQHVGPLVGRRAHRDLWPQLSDWMWNPSSEANR
jgi:poly[(R)-3-hydroxyalkanoate] polymerase subunit PhaC